MIKVTMLMVIAISTASVLAMILAPTTMTTNVVKAFSCSSSSSAALASSSSSLSKGQIGSVGCSSDLFSHCSEDVNIGAGVTTSSSSGGSQSSCSSSSASQQFASTFSQSQQGRCP